MNAPEDSEREILRYREGPELLEQAVIGLQDSQLDARPAGGGWSVREIVHHIADGDDIWKMGIKMAIGNEQAEFDLGWYSSLPQRTWGDRWAYSRRSIRASLSLLRASREHVVQLLASVPEVWSRPIVVRTPIAGIEHISVGWVIQMQADHVMHHLERIRAIIREVGVDQVQQPYTLGTWTAKAGREKELIAEWQKFAKWTSERYPGAGTAVLLQDSENPRRFVSCGPWDNTDSIKGWRESPEFKAFALKVRELCDEFQPRSLALAATSSE